MLSSKPESASPTSSSVVPSLNVGLVSMTLIELLNATASGIEMPPRRGARLVPKPSREIDQPVRGITRCNRGSS